MQGASIPEHTKLYAAAVVAAVLGDNPAKALESLEATIRQRPQDLDLKYDSVRALALVSKALSAHDPPEGRKLAARAIQRLREVVQQPDADLARIDNDAALDSLRDDPAFLDMMRAGHSDRRYAAVWTRDSGYESGVKLGSDPVAQLQYARDMIGQNYRPVASSGARTASDSSLVTASVWRRPLVSESMKDELAERQATAVALVRLGKGELVWPLLVHDADPRVRSFHHQLAPTDGSGTCFDCPGIQPHR